MTPTKIAQAAVKRLRGFTPGNRKWQLDIGYWGSLSAGETLWMTQFLSEYYNGQIHKDDTAAIHRTDEHRKECYNRAKSCDRDVYAIHECSNKLLPTPEE